MEGTRPKPVYCRQGVAGGIEAPGYSLGQYILLHPLSPLLGPPATSFSPIKSLSAL